LSIFAVQVYLHTIIIAIHPQRETGGLFRVFEGGGWNAKEKERTISVGNALRGQDWQIPGGNGKCYCKET
jgi:hypothetical protein